jgi:hypothetical protein
VDAKARRTAILAIASGVIVFGFGLYLSRVPGIYDIVKGIVISAGGVLIALGLTSIYRKPKRPDGAAGT